MLQCEPGTAFRSRDLQHHCSHAAAAAAPAHTSINRATKTSMNVLASRAPPWHAPRLTREQSNQSIRPHQSSNQSNDQTNQSTKPASRHSHQQARLLSIHLGSTDQGQALLGAPEALVHRNPAGERRGEGRECVLPFIGCLLKRLDRRRGAPEASYPGTSARAPYSPGACPASSSCPHALDPS